MQSTYVPNITSGIVTLNMAHIPSLFPRALPEVDRFLHNHSRRRHAILGDGNCLFRSFSFILLGTEENHQSVRATIVNVIEKNPIPFIPLCHPTTVVEYVHRMKNNYTWGTDVEIFALSALLGKPIYVALHSNINWLYTLNT